jgi:SAM-dependent methyltransferase
VSWNNKYQKNKRIWGDRPSELALFTVKYLKNLRLDKRNLELTDIGCGYGRDVLYLTKYIKGNIMGIDVSSEAINMAVKSQNSTDRLKFRCCNFKKLRKKENDVIFVSNLYHLLRNSERKELRNKIKSLLKFGGLLFLNTLSVNDPEEYGKGSLIDDEPNSFEKDKYLHFSTKRELKNDFRFLYIKELFEHEFDEFHVQGKTHHHINWILVAEKV